MAPRLNKKSARVPHKQAWTRQGGCRLKRLQDPPTSSSPDSEYRDRLHDLIVPQYILKKHVVYKKCKQAGCRLLQLPEELWRMVLVHLSCAEVEVLAQTCKWFKEFANRNYVRSVTLPLSAHNLRKLSGRSVLSLTSEFDILALKDADYLNMTRDIDLTNLKALCFLAPQLRPSNIGFLSMYFTYYPVSKLYKNCLTHYLLQAPYLQTLNIAVDTSPDMSTVLDIISNKLSCLVNLTMRGAWHIEEHTVLPLNYLLERVLRNPSIRNLALVGLFGDGLHYDIIDYRIDPYELVLRSKNLQSLKLINFTFCEFKIFECENLKEMYHNADYPTPEVCLNHGVKAGANELAYMLYNQCPKLEKYNDVDIAMICSAAGSGNWIELLRKKRKSLKKCCNLED